MLHSTELLITSKELVAGDVVVLELADPGRAPLPAWSPGAHITLHLANGQSREYSLCGSPTDGCATWRIAVRLDPNTRGGSKYIHHELDRGQTVPVSGPRNHFALVDSDRYLFVAGGIGITPLIPMMEQVEASDAEWTCVYLGRSLASMPFVEELIRRYPGKIRVHASAEAGRIGLAPLIDDLSGAAVYTCGPEAMIDELETQCTTKSTVELHTERFSPKTVQETERVEFDAVIAETGLVLRVPPDRSLLDVLLDADLDLMSSCEEGTCGTCEVRVLAGVPDHRDSVLSKAEQDANDRMIPCVSRCRGERIVIEI